MNRSNKTRAALAAAVLTALAGCTTVGPDYRVPPDAVVNRPGVAATFLGAAETPFQSAALPANWWRLYQDASLDGLIQKALAANTDLRIASANLARVRALQEEIEVAAGPVVGVNAAPGYGRASAAAKGRADPLPAGWTHDAGISVSYQADLFGRIARAVEAAQADTGAARAGYDLARVMVAADTARAYVDACAAGRQMVVAQESIDLQGNSSH